MPFMPRQHAIRPPGLEIASAGSAPDSTHSISAADRIDLTTIARVLSAAGRFSRKKCRLPEILMAFRAVRGL
jgi:hypothetical protein